MRLERKIVTLVPVKPLRIAKRRLSGFLLPSERLKLALYMLEDVLNTLRDVESIVTIVITGDQNASGLARRLGLRVLNDSGLGETVAVAAATQRLERLDFSGSLVIPADVPLVTGEEIEMLVSRAPASGSVLVPSRNGRGSNAILRKPPGLFPLRFGEDSFLPHVSAAKATGRPAKIVELDGLGLDIDEAEDLLELMHRPERTRSQRFLSHRGVDSRLDLVSEYA